MSVGVESEVVRAEREEQRALRDAEDFGGTRRVNGVRYDIADLPSPDEL